MKKIVLLFCLVISTLVLNATITVTPLWERSRASGNSAPRVMVGLTTSQRTIAVANDTIFLSDNNAGTWGNPSLVHCYNTLNGDFLVSYASPAGDNVTLVDDANNIATAGTEGASSLDLSIREANGLYTKVPLGPTYKLAMPAVMGDLNGTAYVFTFVANSSQIRRYTLVNKAVTDIKTVTITDLHATYKTRETSVMPLTKDLVVVTMSLAFSAYIDMNHGDYLYADINRFITKNLPVDGAVITTQLGGALFTYNDHVYLVQGWTPSTEELLYAGSFKIYDITDPTNATVTYSHPENLGVSSPNFKTISFQAVVKEDGVYIYQYAPMNGMAAYKFVDDTASALKETNSSSSCYAENGVVKVVAPMGELVELYNLAGQLITSTTACQPITSLHAENQHIVIVRVAGQAHKVVL